MLFNDVHQGLLWGCKAFDLTIFHKMLLFFIKSLELIMTEIRWKLCPKISTDNVMLVRDKRLRLNSLIALGGGLGC